MGLPHTKATDPPQPGPKIDRIHSLFVFVFSSVFEQILSKRLKFKIIIKEKVLNEVEIAVSSLIV